MSAIADLVGLIVSVAWAVVPFAVLLLTFVLFGIRSRLDALLAEQHDATKLINGLRNDVRKSLAEPGEPQGGGPGLS